jgi:putative DNA primase/helicase
MGQAYHPYLTAKGIVPAPGMKQLGSALVLPVFDAAHYFSGATWDEDKLSTLINLQLIAPLGSKRFLRHGRIRGGCFVLGTAAIAEPQEVVIAEGVATAVSLRTLTHSPVVAAFNANNLPLVAWHVRQRWPKTSIIIAGDDDALTERDRGINPGKLRATQAALLVQGRVSLPPFSETERLAGLSDWNDYCCRKVLQHPDDGTLPTGGCHG